MALLYLDVLGIKALMQREGRNAVAEVAGTFHQELLAAVASEPNPTVTGGIISDAAALIFDSTLTAARVASDTYRRLFRLPKKRGDRRIWVRGVIAPAPADGQLLTTSQISTGEVDISSTQWTEELLDAVIIEGAGVKGMRLFIHGDLIGEELRDSLAIPIKTLHFVPLRRLNNSRYASPVMDVYSDVLWMATPTLDDLEDLDRAMDDRLRWVGGGGSDAEFLHAAATKLVFAEASAIVRSVAFRMTANR